MSNKLLSSTLQPGFQANEQQRTAPSDSYGAMIYCRITAFEVSGFKIAVAFPGKEPRATH